MNARAFVASFVAAGLFAAVHAKHLDASGGGIGGILPQTVAAIPIGGGGSGGGGNVALGQRLADSYGWSSGQQWTCLYDLWQRESGWSNTADNPQSGAYGIAQALGHGPTNQYPAGPANPPASSATAQIKWGLGYIRGTYGDPCGAWSHETADNWY